MPPHSSAHDTGPSENERQMKVLPSHSTGIASTGKDTVMPGEEDNRKVSRKNGAGVQTKVSDII